MEPGKRYAHLHMGNLIQLAGAASTCYGIARIAGLGIALIVTGVVLAVLANFEYDNSVLHVPLPTKRPAWQRGTLMARLHARLPRVHLPRLRWRRATQP